MCVWFMVCWLCAPDHDSTRPVTRRVLARAVRVPGADGPDDAPCPYRLVASCELRRVRRVCTLRYWVHCNNVNGETQTGF